MGTYIIGGILMIGCVFAVISYLCRLRSGDSCCGTREASPPRVKAADRNKNNYPHAALLTIDGMTCANCARHVENALNSLDGTYATVDLGKRNAKVYCKTPFDEAHFKRTIKECGYTVLALDKLEG